MLADTDREAAVPASQSAPASAIMDDDNEVLKTPRGRGWLISVSVLLLAAAASAATYYFTRTSQNGSTTQTTVTRSVTLAPVSVRNLVQTASYTGSLDYANQIPIAAGSSSTSSASSTTSSSSSVVTAVPAVGKVVYRGDVLFTVNAAPTVLLYGAVPMYRALQSGVANGPDILQLKRNMAALGYAPSGMALTTAWDGNLTTAVYAWEAALAVTQDGVVPANRIVFEPGRVRIYSAAAVGTVVTPTTTVVTISSTRKVATLALTVADATIAAVGEPVTLTLPSGATVPGAVQSVGTTATASSSASSSSGGGSSGGAVNQTGASASTSSATIQVTVYARDTPALAGLSTAPVDVTFNQQRANNVLAVPTTALVTLADGGFAVEVSDGPGRTHYVRVTPGLFAAGGYVQISGSITAGQKVVVPQ